MRIQKDEYLATALGILAVLLQLLTPNVLGFHRDELLYISMAEHPAAGYYSIPPFTGLMAWLSVKAFGFTLFATKFLPAVTGGILVYLIARMVRELKGDAYAQILSVVSFVATVLFVRVYSLFQPVPFDLFFWTLLILILLRFINTRNPQLMIFFGIVTGIGILNKYNIIFLVIPVLIALALSKYRKIYASKYFWIAVIITLLIALPNIVWQYLHGFPVIGHMAELRSSQLVNMNPATFLAEQLLMVMPATLIVIPGLIWLLTSRQMKEYRILGWTCIGVLALFILLQGKSYYSAGIYPFLAAAGGTFIAVKLKNIYLRILLLGVMVYSGYMTFPMAKPVYPPERLEVYFNGMASAMGNDAVRRDEDNNYNKLPQDFSDMLGWNELTAITAETWKKCDPKSTIIYCENYGQAGAITVLSKKYGLPHPVSFSESFLYWSPKSFENEITTFIYINDELGEDVKALFGKIEVAGSITNPYARERNTTVYLCTEPRQSFNQFYEERIKGIEHRRGK